LIHWHHRLPSVHVSSICVSPATLAVRATKKEEMLVLHCGKRLMAVPGSSKSLPFQEMASHQLEVKYAALEASMLTLD